MTRFGRRVLILGSTGGMVISLGGLTIGARARAHLHATLDARANLPLTGRCVHEPVRLVRIDAHARRCARARGRAGAAACAQARSCMRAYARTACVQAHRS
eukprot:5928818-Pleurochrysis_carterae.AAC.1